MRFNRATTLYSHREDDALDELFLQHYEAEPGDQRQDHFCLTATTNDPTPAEVVLILDRRDLASLAQRLYDELEWLAYRDHAEAQDAADQE